MLGLLIFPITSYIIEKFIANIGLPLILVSFLNSITKNKSICVCVGSSLNHNRVVGAFVVSHLVDKLFAVALFDVTVLHDVQLWANIQTILLSPRHERQQKTHEKNRSLL